MIYSNYLRSSHWIQTRLDIIQIRKHCERCGSTKNLQVHHLSYKNLGNEEPEDLELLCSACHLNEHGKLKKKKPVKRVKKPTPLSKKQKRALKIKSEMKASRKFQNKALERLRKWG